MRYNLSGVIASDDDVEIYRWYGYQAVCPADIRAAVSGTPQNEEFVLEINSGGGDVFAGYEMYSVIRGAKCKTRAEVQSIAGSAASIVLAAVDEATASPVGQVMIHLPSTRTDGNLIEHEQSVQMLEACTESIINAYAVKCGSKTTRANLRRMMERETFLTAQDAKQIGLIDDIICYADDEPTGAGGGRVMNALGLPDIGKLRAAYNARKIEPPEPAADPAEMQAAETRRRAVEIENAAMEIMQTLYL